ncbi:MAG: hypothetical protein ACFFBP_16745 [Promethearchaeota archaeon]
MIIFELKEEDYEIVDLDDEDVSINSLLSTDKILYFIDSRNSIVWVWEGKSTNTKMKFIAAKIASNIRDKYGITYNISIVDEDNEPEEFLSIIEIEEEVPISQ